MTTPIRTELSVADIVPFGQPLPGRDSRYGFYALTLEKPEWKSWQPGQFIMLRPSEGRGRMLARPFPICRVTSQSLVLFFEVSDPGTEELSRLKSGDGVIVWGPLGNGFVMDSERPALLLAYGSGIAPFAGYADMHPAPERLSMVFGHRAPNSCYPTDAMASRMYMEDVLDRTEKEREMFRRSMLSKLEECGEAGGVCLACGPMWFMSWVWENAGRLGVPAQLALSSRISCGIGACLGCSTLTSSHWPDEACAGLPVQTCTSGPVFWASEIDLSEYAAERSS
ncbi:MAG: dihydroorotate dehydrogenase electron transfer subunit [Mailhella sp.]|nr:dihydroorotate dehydrogenase electron transfer subunit [Mailhella sp.]